MELLPVWKFFTRENSEVTCILCSWKHALAKDCSTSNLVKHLTGPHAIQKDALQKFVPSGGQLTFSARPGRAQCIRLLMRWLLADLRPLSLSDSSYFRDFISMLGAPPNQIPDSTNLTRTYLPKLYKAGKGVVKLVLKNAAGLSCTFDSWTEHYSTRSYVTLSIVVLKEWKLQTICLATRHVKESHTAEVLAEWVKLQLSEYGVDVKAPLIAATTDTTAVMPSTIAQLGIFFVPCLAHTINLIMKDIFDIEAVRDFVDRMRRICKFVRKSTIATELLEQEVIVQADSVRADARTIYGPLKDESKRKLPTRLKNMVKTRWNSGYDMLLRLWILYPCLLRVIPRLVARRTPVPDALKEASVADRENIFRIQRVLTDLVITSKEVQEQSTPALGKAILGLFFARSKLQQVAQIEQGLPKRIADQGLKSLQSRFFAPDSLFRKVQTINPAVLSPPLAPAHAIASAFDVAVLAAVFDPRTSKMLLSELQHSQLLSAVRGSAHANPVLPHILGLIRNATGAPAAVAAPMMPAAGDAPVTGDTMEDDEILAEGSLDPSDYWRRKRRRATPLVQEGSIEEQARQFLAEDIEPMYEQMTSDPLEYWKVQSKRWPALASVAAQYLPVMSSSAEAERNFSTAGDIVTAQRASLKPERVDQLLFLAKNIRTGVITVEHMLEAFNE